MQWGFFPESVASLSGSRVPWLVIQYVSNNGSESVVLIYSDDALYIVRYCCRTVLVHVMLVPCFSITAAGRASLRLGDKCDVFGNNLSKLADELSEVNTKGIVSGFTNVYLAVIKGEVDTI